jgi:hypothetical protein
MAKPNSKWLGKKAAGGDHRRVRTDIKIDDAQHGDQTTEHAWVERRKESTGWRNGAKVSVR